MTVTHTVRTYSSKEELPREEQLAHKLASVATDPVAVEPEVCLLYTSDAADDVYQV